MTSCTESESSRPLPRCTKRWPRVRALPAGGRPTRKGKEVGGVFQLRFHAGSGDGGLDVKVLELQPAKRVLWQVVEGPAEWIGTKISFDLKQESDYVIVLFKHQGWKEPVEFMHHCSTKWAIFLMSLKALVETGKGAPDPHDLKIDNWN